MKRRAKHGSERASVTSRPARSIGCRENTGKRLSAAYPAMAANKDREAEADEWCEALVSDVIASRLNEE
jgi:hypothetical protein